MVALTASRAARDPGLVVVPRSDAGETRLVVGGEIDLSTAPTFLGALAFALRARPALVELDLRALTFIDARCAGAIASAAARMSGWGGTLVAREPREIVRCAFELCGIGDLLWPRRAAGAGRLEPVA